MRRLLVIPLVLILLLAGAMVLSGTSAEKRSEFSFINRGDINTLDLNQMSYMQDFRLTYSIREGLYDLEPKTFKPIPAGAIGHELSDDKKVWTFHLRKECKWSNGDPVTSADYVFSWRRMLEEPGEYTYLFEKIRNAKAYEDSFAHGEPVSFSTVGIEAPDPLTIRVTLENPVPYLLELAAFPPFYPRHARSMAKFQVFADTDVMETFERYVAAAQTVDRSGSSQEVAARFAKAVGLKRRALDPNAVSNWLDAVKDFDISAKTQDELFDALAVFATMNPLEGVPAQAQQIASSDDDGVEDHFSPLAPAEKLKRMLALRFIRHTYSKGYTLPGVITNGPFIMTRWDFKRRILLQKSNQYWDKEHVKCNSAEMVVALNAQSQLLLYETGKVDWITDVDNELATELKEKGRSDLRLAPAFGTAFLTLLCSPQLPQVAGGGPNPLSDVRVRQALAMSIDKRFIVENRTKMGELPARTYLPPDGTLPQFRWSSGLVAGDRREPYRYEEMQKLLRSKDGLIGPGPGLPYDIERARMLLAEAGYPDGKGFPNLPILFNSDNNLRRDICAMLKNDWKRNLNIDIAIQPVELKIFSRSCSTKEYAIATVAWYGDYPDISTFTDKYLSTGLQNDSNWINLKYDDLCAQAAREPDVDKRIAILSEAENMIDTQVPIIPLYHYVNMSLSRDSIHGVEPNPRNITIFKNIWIERGTK